MLRVTVTRPRSGNVCRQSLCKQFSRPFSAPTQLRHLGECKISRASEKRWLIGVIRHHSVMQFARSSVLTLPTPIRTLTSSSTSTPTDTSSITPKSQANNDKQKQNLLLIKTYVRQGDLDSAILVLEKHHQQHGFPLIIDAYTMILHAALKKMNNKVFEQVLDYMSKYSIPYDSATYLALFMRYGKTNQLAEVEKLWQKLKSESPHLINSHIISGMLTNIRKLKLGIEKLAEVFEIAKQMNISLNTDAIIYRDLFHLLRDMEDMTGFVALYEQYMAALKQHQVEPHPQIWVHVIYMYSLYKPTNWIQVVEDAIQRAKQHKDVKYWKSLLYAFFWNSEIGFMEDLFDFITEELGIQPNQQMIFEYCRCIFHRTYDGTLRWLSDRRELLKDKNDNTKQNKLTGTEDEREARGSKIPADVDVLEAYHKVKSLSAKFGVPLKRDGCSLLLLALARSRHYDELDNELRELEKNQQFTMNVREYTAQIILTANKVELGDERLDILNRLRSQAQQALLPQNKDKATSAVLQMYTSLLCAYSMLKSSDAVNNALQSVINEMKSKNITLMTLPRMVIAFDMTMESMDRLLKLTKEHWPSFNLTKFTQSYCLVYMMDMVRRGAVRVGVNTSNKQQEQARIELMKKKLREALNVCSQNFNDLNIGVFVLWARLLAYYGDYNGVRAVISVVEEERKLLKGYPGQFRTYNLILKKLDEADLKPRVQ